MVTEINSDVDSSPGEASLAKINDKCLDECTLKMRNNTINTESIYSTTIAEPFNDPEVTECAKHEDGECNEADAIAYTHRRWIYIGILCLAIVAHGISATVIFPFASFMVRFFAFLNSTKHRFTIMRVDR